MPKSFSTVLDPFFLSNLIKFLENSSLLKNETEQPNITELLKSSSKIVMLKVKFKFF